MKKLSFFLALTFAVLSLSPITAHANMAAPLDSDIGSSVTFEKNDDISVLSEVLDITVDGDQAGIVATYTMKNSTNETVTTPSMFISPNVEQGGVQVVVDGKEATFQVESFKLNYDTGVETNDWQYAVLSDDKIASDDDTQTVDTVTFELSFEPNEQYDVVVSYSYRLGGRPDIDFDAKYGEIKYYLTPAASWKDFENLTINLYLDNDMPILVESETNLDFEKVSSRTYRYVSDSLPEHDLTIVIDQNDWQSFWAFFRNPYMGMALMMLSPILIPIALIAAIIIWRIVKKKKQNKLK